MLRRTLSCALPRRNHLTMWAFPLKQSAKEHLLFLLSGTLSTYLLQEASQAWCLLWVPTAYSSGIVIAIYQSGTRLRSR